MCTDSPRLRSWAANWNPFKEKSGKKISRKKVFKAPSRFFFLLNLAESKADCKRWLASPELRTCEGRAAAEGGWRVCRSSRRSLHLCLTAAKWLGESLEAGTKHDSAAAASTENLGRQDDFLHFGFIQTFQILKLRVKKETTETSLTRKMNIDGWFLQNEATLKCALLGLV